MSKSYSYFARPESLDLARIQDAVSERYLDAITIGIEWEDTTGQPMGIALWTDLGLELAERYGYALWDAYMAVPPDGRPEVHAAECTRHASRTRTVIAWSVCHPSGGVMILGLDGVAEGQEMRPGMIHTIARQVARDLRTHPDREVRISVQVCDGREEPCGPGKETGQ